MIGNYIGCNNIYHILYYLSLFDGVSLEIMDFMTLTYEHKLFLF